MCFFLQSLNFALKNSFQKMDKIYKSVQPSRSSLFGFSQATYLLDAHTYTKKKKWCHFLIRQDPLLKDTPGGSVTIHLETTQGQNFEESEEVAYDNFMSDNTHKGQTEISLVNVWRSRARHASKR
jgi:hypothetical protein